MNREQSQALVDLWDDLEIIGKQHREIRVDQIDMVVREEGDDIEVLTGECGWVELVLFLYGSGPLLIMDPRGVIHREIQNPNGTMRADPCQITVRDRDGKMVLATEPAR